MKPRSIQGQAVGLRFELPPWGTADALPTSFLLFAYGTTSTTKGLFYLDEAHADRVLAAWKHHKADLSGDYEHAGADGAPAGAPASFWASLEKRIDGIWATGVQWTERAAGYLRAREYRYYSPFFLVETDDEGKDWVVEILNVALTNLPATHNQRPLVARALAGKPTKRPMARELRAMTSEELVAQIASKLAEKGMDEEAARGAAMEIVLMYKDMESGEAAPVEAPAADAPAEPEYMSTTPPAPPGPALGRVGAALGIAGEASEEAVLAVLAQRAEALTSLASRLQVLERDKQSRDKENAEALFLSYQREARFRANATKDDPDGSKHARIFLARFGVEAFKAAFPVALTHQLPPPPPSALPQVLAVGAPGQSVASDPTVITDAEAKDYLAKNPGTTYRQALSALSRQKKNGASA